MSTVPNNPPAAEPSEEDRQLARERLSPILHGRPQEDIVARRIAARVRAECAKAVEEATKELREENERLKGETMCDSCTGKGHALDGGPCMCGGTGKLSDGVDYLRGELYDTAKERDRLRAELAAAMECIKRKDDKFRELTGYGRKDMGHQQMCDYVTETAEAGIVTTPASVKEERK